ncbi:MAG: type II toxin-antitoxin system VapC family toxin [Candidatus Dadabacteria bacterium]|nr:type II toxin-antitoxin system VapC family toxin [Candidatus Dadabacteria bacterium]
MPSIKKSDQQYSESDALVLELWYLEASNVLLSAERNGDITLAQTDAFTSQLEDLPITVDSSTWRQSFTRTMTFAPSYGLSNYDTSYLELAVRESLMLASLDRTLLKAAQKAGVSIYLKEKQG